MIGLYSFVIILERILMKHFSLSNVIAKLRAPEFKTEVRIGIVSGSLAVAGQLIRFAPFEYAPQYLRWHMSNIADAPLAASIVNNTIIFGTRASHPVVAATTGLASGIAWETYQSTWPRRSFDYADCGHYLIGAVAYVAIRRALTRRLQHQQRNAVAPHRTACI